MVHNQSICPPSTHNIQTIDSPDVQLLSNCHKVYILLFTMPTCSFCSIMKAAISTIKFNDPRFIRTFEVVVGSDKSNQLAKSMKVPHFPYLLKVQHRDGKKHLSCYEGNNADTESLKSFMTLK